MPEVSVIIPVYKVESFVERCVRGLMEQTLQEVEFIFVDDASPDGSVGIVRRVTAEYDRDVRILVHPENRGLPAARNTGLAEARGRYVFHCDSDDWPEPDMLEKMYRKAVEAEADFVYCDFFLEFGTGRRYMTTPDYASPEEMVKDGFLVGNMKYNVWNKLIAKDLYDGVQFPEGHGMGEDMTIIPLATRARRVARVPEALYHYIKINAGAFSASMSERRLSDIRFNVDRTVRALEAWETADREKYLAFFKLNAKLPFLFSGDKAQYRLWTEWYPEADRYIPENTSQPRRTRLVQQWAAKGRFGLVRLYAFAVNNIYYRFFR
jgi:glycosyltransferase involved in cell wall biosynthesis